MNERLVTEGIPVNPDFVALDFETANRNSASVCAVGLAFVENGKVVANPSWLVRPPRSYFDPDFIKIHGITPERVSEAPEFGDLWPQLNACLAGRLVIAHNAAFDIDVLISAMKHFRLPMPMLEYSCTMIIAQRVWPKWGRYGLAPLAQRHGIVFQHHDAAEDAAVCAQIALLALAEKRSTGLTELAAALNISHGRLSPDSGHQKLSTIVACPALPAFGHWNAAIHDSPEQVARRQRALEIKEAAIDLSNASAVINGYQVTLDSCTCVDFRNRRLPCKHIYHLAMGL